MIRRRTVPWIHRWSRLIIGSIAILGMLDSGYLTLEKLTGSQVACNAGCDRVLSSPYATPFGVPLSLFGFLAYTTMAILAFGPLLIKDNEKKNSLRTQDKDITWLLLLIGATSMAVFSGYLMFLLVTEIKAVCPYCIASAIFAFSILILTIKGKDWPELGQIFSTMITTGIITLVGILIIYANIGSNAVAIDDKGVTKISGPTTYPEPPYGWEVKTISGPAELALVEYLDKIGSKMYGAFWCPHCFDQKQLFGHDAAKKLPYIECAEQGNNSNPEACVAAKVQSFPTWVIKGQTISGTQELQELAKISDYKGPTNFKYKLK